ncbi:uroporphyrinogen III synthase [Skermanella stibiiresistens SB22]|uniref:Uroporphyrinogen-III synthase n=1 Tax=Skermanella stibiiresistens SB22 TaxID=1385369 RepID=W9H750_9PROT|nr:uroporphyrinogen-III synthase [Skermanella stibiiresistens]EWY40527.1 uroporphyrinogen III synthase [Skermanella stibiiresistens SB22]
MTGKLQRILITRPRDDAEALAAELTRRGFEAMVQPLLEIRNLPGPPLDLSGVQALLCTSANGVRATAARTTRRDLPVLAVGDATARAALDDGFIRVESAKGDVQSLAKLAIDRLDPGAGRLLHAAGSAVAGDLAGELGAAGFTVERHVLYAAEPASGLLPETVQALYAGTIDAALFFSPRTAQSFVKVVGKAGLTDRLGGILAVCLSEAVGDAVRTVCWRDVVTARRPDQAALLDLLAAPARSPPV